MTLDFRHIAGALVLHAILFALLLTGVQCTRQIDVSPPIMGVLVTPQELGAPSRSAPAPSPPVPELQNPPPDDGAQLMQRQAAEQQHQAELQQEVEKQAAEKAAADAAEQLKIAEDAELKQKQAEEKAQAERAKQAEEAQRAAEEAQRAAEDAKRKADAEAAAKQKAEDAKRQQELQQQAQSEELKRQAEEEDRKRRQDQVKREAAAEKQRMMDFQKELGVASGQIAQNVQQQWLGAMEASISRNWVQPSSVNDSLVSKVQINLSPSGDVLSVSTVRSSGNPLYDSAVVAAIRKSSPLPTPSDPGVFQTPITVNFPAGLFHQ